MNPNTPCTSQVIRLQPPENIKKTTQIKQTVQFPSAFRRIPNSGQHFTDNSLVRDDGCHLPHVYGTVFTKTEPYQLCDFYSVAIRNVTLTSFDVVVKRVDKSKPWDNELYLSYHAEMVNSFNFCTTVGTNVNSKLKQCEYMLVFPQPLERGDNVGLSLQAYCESDLQFAITTKYVDERKVICVMKRICSSTHEWAVPVKILCRVFRQPCNQQFTVSGCIDFMPNTTNMKCVQQIVNFPSQFSPNPNELPRISFGVLSNKNSVQSYSGEYIHMTNNTSDDERPFFSTSVKNLTSQGFTLLLSRIDSDGINTNGWGESVRVFWFAECQTHAINVQFGANPSLAYGVQSHSQSNNQHYSPQQQSMYSSFQENAQPSVSTQPSVPPQQSMPAPPYSGQSSSTNLPPPPQVRQKTQTQPPPFNPNANRPSQPQKVVPTSASQRVESMHDMCREISTRQSEPERLGILQGNLFSIKNQVQSNEVQSMLQFFQQQKKDALLILVNATKLNLRGFDIPTLLNPLRYEHEKYELLKRITENYLDVKLSSNEARATLEQFKLPQTRIDALELIASRVSDAKKSGKNLVAMFPDKETQKRAKKALGLKKFGLF